MVCPTCGSWDLSGFEGAYETGVEADGYKERRRYVGWRCRACGAEGEA